ncbi:MAG: class I SAM-dependent methyltransferase [Bacteroidetes bacterium]|nr:class I SAM-dependent methyltransferase [Bacteroidota bacterium]
MEYDPIKRSLGNVFNKSPFLRKAFYHLLDLLLLRAWHVHKEIKRLTPALSKGEGVNILDAGSGFGQYSYWMTNKFPKAEILAVDVKDEQVADCNNFFQQIGKKNVKFEVADLTKFVQENKFDLALSVDVMEHILEDVLVFKNILASLKKGGMLLISTPSDQGGSDVHEEHEGSFIGEHVRDGYNIKEIEDKLKLAGFSKVDARYDYGTPGKISWRLSMKYPMIMLNTTKLFFIIIPFYYIITYPFAFILNYFDTNTSHKTGTGLIVKTWK